MKKGLFKYEELEKIAPVKLKKRKKNTWQKEWISMPEYNNTKIVPFQTIKVHFKCKEDYDAFAKLVKQNLTEHTLCIWYPKPSSVVSSVSINSKMRYDDEK